MDRDLVADVTVTLRITKSERDALTRLVEKRQAEVSRVAPGVIVTMTAVMRCLIADAIGEMEVES